MIDTRAHSSPWLNVIVLHWEDSKALRRCLEHLAQSDHPALRVLVVENGSSPAEQESARLISDAASSRFPWFHFLQQGSNLGYVGGNNAGVAYLQQQQLAGDFCILNPDVAVAPATLSSMAAAAQQSAVGLVMTSALSPQGTRLYDGFRLHGFRQSSTTSNLPVADTDYAQGACMLVHRDLLATSLFGQSLFDSRFFLYWEEVDLSLRVRQLGYRVVSSTFAPVTRSDNQLSRLPTALYYSARNAWLLKQKHPADFATVSYIRYFAWLASLTAKLVPQPSLFVAAWRSLVSALLDARAGRFGLRSTRSAVRPQACPHVTEPSL